MRFFQQNDRPTMPNQTSQQQSDGLAMLAMHYIYYYFNNKRLYYSSNGAFQSHSIMSVTFLEDVDDVFELRDKEMYQWQRPNNAWQRGIATKLALCLQAKYRGYKARSVVWKMRILFIVRAAKVIQHAFRVWKLNRMTFPTSYRLKSKIPPTPPTALAWESLPFGRGSYHERIALWRAVIELRRAHPHFCTDVCLRALILAEGNLQRALIIIANPEFHLSAQSGLDLSFEQRCLFLPFVESTPLKLEEAQSGRRLDPKAAKKINVNLRLYHYIMNVDTGGRGMSQGMTRFLEKSKKIREEKKMSFTVMDYSDTLYRSFFSLSYEGHDRPGAMRFHKTAPKPLGPPVDAEKMKAMKTQPSMKEKLMATLKSNTNFNATNLGMGIVEDDPDDIM